MPALYRCRTLWRMDEEELRRVLLVAPRHEELVACSTGDLVPRYFVARVDHPAAPWIVILMIAMEPDGSAVCHNLSSTRREKTDSHAWVHDVATNLPEMGLRDWVRFAVALMAEQVATGHNPLSLPPMSAAVSGDPVAVDAWSNVGNVYAAQRTNRRTAVTPERLAEVARIYREAIDNERTDPTVAVAEALHLSRPHAARLVSKARAQGELGGAKPGTWGEA